MVKIHGFEHGQRVRHIRHGSTGTVRVWDLSDSERAEGCAEAEVRWDGTAVADELDADTARNLRAI
jgi:hypothetical protein